MKRPGAVAAVVDQVTVDAGSVRCGDQIMVGGQVLTVRDMVALPRGGRRLEFVSGETFTMRASTVVWAARRRGVLRTSGPRRRRG